MRKRCRFFFSCPPAPGFRQSGRVEVLVFAPMGAREPAALPSVASDSDANHKALSESRRLPNRASMPIVPHTSPPRFPAAPSDLGVVLRERFLKQRSVRPFANFVLTLPYLFSLPHLPSSSSSSSYLLVSFPFLPTPTPQTPYIPLFLKATKFRDELKRQNPALPASQVMSQKTKLARPKLRTASRASSQICGTT